jgi:opacity protein-like surface antigen
MDGLRRRLNSRAAVNRKNRLRRIRKALLFNVHRKDSATMNKKRNASWLWRAPLAAILSFAPISARAQDCCLEQPMVAPACGAYEDPDRSYDQTYGCDRFGPCASWNSQWLGGYGGIFFSDAGTVAVANRPGNEDFSVVQGGASGGGLLGYNFGCLPKSATRGWLWGAELEFAGLSGSKVKNDAALGDVQVEGSWIGSLQLRGGHAWKKTYIYGMTGPAISDINGGPTTDNKDSARGGWAFGIGVERKINHDWST